MQELQVNFQIMIVFPVFISYRIINLFIKLKIKKRHTKGTALPYCILVNILKSPQNNINNWKMVTRAIKNSKMAFVMYGQE